MSDTRPRQERSMPSMKLGERYVTAYDPGIAMKVCEEIAEGKLLKDVLSLPDMPARSTWYRWCMLYPDLKTAYDIARQISAEVFEESMLEKAFELIRGEAASSALDLDQIKTGLSQLRWSASRRNPAQFADKPNATAVIPIQINTSLNIDGKAADAPASIYSIRAIAPAPTTPAEDVEDVLEFEVPEAGKPALVTSSPKPERRRPHHKTAAGIAATKRNYAKRKERK